MGVGSGGDKETNVPGFDHLYWVSHFITVPSQKQLTSLSFIYHSFPLDCKEIQPGHSKGDQSWVFFGRNDAEAETPVLLPGKSHGWRRLVGCSPWGREESDMTERLKKKKKLDFIQGGLL